MIFGSKKLFAIECEIQLRTDTWVFGNFCFWIFRKDVGNYEDFTSLNGCFGWLKHFIEDPRDRNEPGLMEMPPEEIFFLLYDSFMPEGLQYNSDNKEPFKDTFGRFYISHLGMSSFDRFDILLIENSFQQRVLWRDASNLIIHEAILPAGEIQRVSQEFCRWFDGYSQMDAAIDNT